MIVEQIGYLKLNDVIKLKQEKETNSIVKSAYNNLIKNYKDIIMFLEAEITSDNSSETKMWKDIRNWFILIFL